MPPTLTREDAAVDAVPAAEKTTADERPRRRWRWIAVALALVLIGATTVAVTANMRARDAARAEAAAEAAADDLTAAFANYHTTLATPTQDGRAAAAAVHLALVDSLRASDRPDGEVFTAAGTGIAAMRDAADRLAAAAAQPLPTIPSELEDRDLGALTRRLQLAREDGFALADELRAAADDAETWVLQVNDVRTRAAEFAAAAEAAPPSATPAGLVQQYESQRPALDRYEASASALAELPGMDQLATAHLDYVRANRGWIDEAVGLLNGNERRRYNARLDEVFAGEDPFGFDAALADATPRALGSQTVTDVDTAQRRAIAYAEQLEDLRLDLGALIEGENPPAELSGERDA